MTNILFRLFDLKIKNKQIIKKYSKLVGSSKEVQSKIVSEVGLE
jgi:hypothetical protein